MILYFKNPRLGDIGFCYITLFVVGFFLQLNPCSPLSVAFVSFFSLTFCCICITKYCCSQFLNKNWTSMSATLTLPRLSGVPGTHTLLLIFISYFNRKFLASEVASRFSINPKVSGPLVFRSNNLIQKIFETPVQLFLCNFISVFFDVQQLKFLSCHFSRVKLALLLRFQPISQSK